MRLTIYDEFFKEIKDIIKKGARFVLKKEGIDKKINIIFISKDKINEMKKEFFKADHYTDVISFDMGEIAEIYISPEVVFWNALELKTDFKEEMLRVVIHGILHLKGLSDDELWEDQEKYVRDIMKNIE